LGQAARARALWQQAKNVARPALRDARVAAAYLAEADYDRARKSYESAIALEPKLFEAQYGLAMLEGDAGDAVACYKHARQAVSCAPDEQSKLAASELAKRVSRFVSNKEDLLAP
jgi:Tfp pilus assembly protein PilF